MRYLTWYYFYFLMSPFLPSVMKFTGHTKANEETLSDFSQDSFLRLLLPSTRQSEQPLKSHCSDRSIMGEIQIDIRESQNLSIIFTCLTTPKLYSTVWTSKNQDSLSKNLTCYSVLSCWNEYVRLGLIKGIWNCLIVSYYFLTQSN